MPNSLVSYKITAKPTKDGERYRVRLVVRSPKGEITHTAEIICGYREPLVNVVERLWSMVPAS